MKNNIINNGGLKLESLVQVTLPYTATRDCFVLVSVANTGSNWKYYLNRNGAQDNTLSFTGSMNLGAMDNRYFPLKKGDTISFNQQQSDGTLTVNVYVM